MGFQNSKIIYIVAFAIGFTNYFTMDAFYSFLATIADLFSRDSLSQLSTAFFYPMSTILGCHNVYNYNSDMKSFRPLMDRPKVLNSLKESRFYDMCDNAFNFLDPLFVFSITLVGSTIILSLPSLLAMMGYMPVWLVKWKYFPSFILPPGVIEDLLDKNNFNIIADPLVEHENEEQKVKVLESSSEIEILEENMDKEDIKKEGKNVGSNTGKTVTTEKESKQTARLRRENDEDWVLVNRLREERRKLLAQREKKEYNLNIESTISGINVSEVELVKGEVTDIDAMSKEKKERAIEEKAKEEEFNAEEAGEGTSDMRFRDAGKQVGNEEVELEAY